MGAGARFGGIYPRGGAETQRTDPDPGFPEGMNNTPFAPSSSASPRLRVRKKIQTTQDKNPRSYHLYTKGSPMPNSPHHTHTQARRRQT